METTAPSRHDVTDFELLVDDNDVTRDFQVLSIAVSNSVNCVATAKLILRDGDPSAEKFGVSEKDTFFPGSKIALKLGDDENKKTVFQGVVTKQCIKARNPNYSHLLVECKHEAVKMTLGRKNNYFDDQKDSEIIEKILGAYSLKGEVDSTTVQHKEVVLFNSSDWDFMVSRAEANGLLVFTENGKLNVKKPTVAASPDMEITYGENILELDAEIDARTQWKNVKTSSWDYAGQALFESETSSSPISEAGNVSGSILSDVGGLDSFELRHTGQVRPEELKEWADAAMLKSRLAKICGRIKIKGNAAIKPGSTVQLAGCGDRFNGRVFVSGVRHEVISGSWFTDIQIGLEPQWFFQQPDIPLVSAGGLTPPVNGLQIGVVVQLQDDPDGEHRILVKIPLVDNQAKGIWSRVATLDAGDDRGTFFRPEIGDEVIIGFLNDDPRDAIVLGMLHSSAKPAPLIAEDDNHIKGLQTRSKMKIMFDDDKKIITIDTPGGNKFIMSEEDQGITLEDQNGNLLKMSPDGIEIKSIKDLKIDAAQNMEGKAGTNLKLEGGANTEIKAGAQLKANGGVQAEYASGGVTQLKGAMVKIN